MVGNVCEAGDVIAKDRPLPRPEVGDLLAILDCGAYGRVLSSGYNGRPPAPEVFIS